LNGCWLARRRRREEGRVEVSLRLALDCSAQLPPQHLGRYAYSWTNGNLESKGLQTGFRKLTTDELRQLTRRLRAAPQHRVVCLNLDRHEMGSDVMQEIEPQTRNYRS
jgi:undecaprenyl pyrophosphate synthase